MSKHLSPSKKINFSTDAVKSMLKTGISAPLSDSDEPEDGGIFSARELGITIAAGVLLVGVWSLPTQGWLRLCSYLIPALLAGYTAIRRAIDQLLSRRFLTRDTLCILVAVIAFCLGKASTGALVMVLYRLLRLVEAFLTERVRMDEEAIYSVLPEKACVQSGNGVESVDAKSVMPGAVLVVEPGDVVALDGVIIDGVTAFDTSPITGEKTPFNGAVGCPVAAGYVNRTGAIRVEVTRRQQDSLAAQMARNVITREGFHSKLEGFTLRFTRIYTPIAFVIAVILAVIPPIFGGGWLNWLSRAGAFLVAASPSGLAVCVRCMYSAGMRSALRSGILIEGTPFLEALSKVDVLVMCKTGIVTDGRYAVTGVFPDGDFTEQELLSTAAEAERGSKHGAARALRTAAGISDEGDTISIEELPGKGISAFVQSHHVYVGTAALLEEHGIRYTRPNRTGAAVHVALDNVYMGHITLTDRVREGSFDALEAVRHMGVTTLVMLTGDVLSVARPVASKLNFDMIRAELSPEGKLSAVEYLAENRAVNATLAFIGNAETDSDIMANADLGIAFDAARSEDAPERADVLIMSDNIRRLPCALKIAGLTVNGAKLSIGVVLGLKAVVLVLSALGLLPIFAAAGIETAAGLFAAINALRACGFDKKMERQFINNERI